MWLILRSAKQKWAISIEGGRVFWNDGDSYLLVDLADGRLLAGFGAADKAAAAADRILDALQALRRSLEVDVAGWDLADTQWDWVDPVHAELGVASLVPEPLPGPAPADDGDEPWDMGPLGQSEARLLYDRFAQLRERRPYPSASEVREAILEICGERWVSALEIGAVLGRSPASVLTKYLTPMVREGLMVKEFSQKRNHPNQRYRSAPAP